MHALSLFAIFAATASIASPLPIGSSNAAVATFDTAHKPENRNHHGKIRSMPSSLDIKGLRRDQNSSDTEVFWAFGDSEPSPSDLPSVQDALDSMTVDGVPVMNTDPAPQATASPTISFVVSSTATPEINKNPLLHEIPHIPVNPTLAAAAAPTISPTSPTSGPYSTTEDPPNASTLAQKHKVILIVAFLSCVACCGLLIWIYAVVTKFGVCNWGRRKRMDAGEAEDTGTEKEPREGGKLNWLSQPADFRVGFMGMGESETGRKGQTLYGRNYDEKGIEQSPPNKQVSFEEIVDIRHELPALSFGLPSNNAAVAVKQRIPAIQEPQSWGLQAGQTLMPSHPPTSRLSPVSFFENDDHISSVSTSPSRISNINISNAHSRAKSAPTVRFRHRDSDYLMSDKSSAASSEWDIARAYGAPRYDKARSVGAMSGASVDSRELEERMRMSGMVVQD